MYPRQRGAAAPIVIILLCAIALAIADIAVLTLAVQQASAAPQAPPLSLLFAAYAPYAAYLVIAPLLFGFIAMLLVGRRAAAPVREMQPVPVAAPAAPSPDPALRLLALLQQEGRLIDFLAEDIAAYDDAHIGAAVRAIHDSCGKALRAHIELQRVFAAEDGSQVTVDPGFDPAAVRLTGNVVGAPPFRGTLQHGGWRATKVSLPEAAGDAHIIAPAEVEIP